MATPVLMIDNIQKATLDQGFAAAFGGEPTRYFSAPGRTEIGGNHTDHQRGRVLAAAVNLDTVAAVRPNGTDLIRILSKGYPRCEINVKELIPKEEEINSTPALIRGVAARFAQLGCEVKGFDAYCESTVLPGSGLSSSAAYEVLIGTIINHLFFDARVTQAEVAQIGQYAENVYFGKPCGLMDQTASAVGNLVTIDFFDKDHPVIEPVDFDFASCGHALCIIDSGADHADLTDEYAAVPGEIKAVAACMGTEVLTQIDEAEFYAKIPEL
ncbi:MAG: galactokinase family protein, partial [Oscillospiraceae bacterium]|nr:galactokinase family protein [Oscillospiraceae bacterium]